MIEVDLIELPGGGMIEVSHGAGEVLRAGFEVESVYADFDKSPFGSKDPGELIFVARKR